MSFNITVEGGGDDVARSIVNKTITAYSDNGMMIERDGVRYSEAIDPAELNRQYTETDEPIECETEQE